MTSISRWIESVWVYRSDGGWLAWSPGLSSGALEQPGVLQQLVSGDLVRVQLSRRPSNDLFLPGGGTFVTRSAIEIRPGLNDIIWPQAGVDGLTVLAQVDQIWPGVLDTVWQWHSASKSWRVVWPRVAGALEPGEWEFPVLRIRAALGAVVRTERLDGD